MLCILADMINNEMHFGSLPRTMLTSTAEWPTECGTGNLSSKESKLVLLSGSSIFA